MWGTSLAKGGGECNDARVAAAMHVMMPDRGKWREINGIIIAWLGEQQQKCWAKRTRVSALHFSNRKVKQPQQPNDGDVTDAGWRGARGGEEHGAGSLPAALITTTKVFELLFRSVCLQRGEGKET